jgi:hypothetical protein
MPSRKVLDGWQWPTGVKNMNIAQRGCEVVSGRANYFVNYDEVMMEICRFVEAYAMRAGIKLVAKNR